MVITRHQSRFQQDSRAHCACCDAARSDTDPKRSASADSTEVHPNFCARKRPPACCRLSRNSIPVTFLAETSIPGMKYIAEENRHLVERLFWMTAFVLSLASSVYLIHGVWDKYKKSPVIVTFDDTEQKLNSIPFPAVTICNNNMVSKRYVDKLKTQMETYGNVSESELASVKNFCSAQKSLFRQCASTEKYSAEELRRASESIRSARSVVGSVDDDKFIRRLIVEGSVPCFDIIRFCKLEGDEIFSVSCHELFQVTVTPYGKCCTFNMLPIPLLLKNGNFENDSEAEPLGGWYEEWTKWDYKKNDIELPPGSYRPWIQKMAGLRYGLSLILDGNLDDYFCDVSDSEGFRFTLHSPLEMPRVTQFSSAIHLGKEVLVEVNAEITKADDEIREFAQEKRKCFFPEERQLELYGPYTGENCMDECIARKIEEACKCKVLHLPETDTNVNLRFCISHRLWMVCAEHKKASIIEGRDDESCTHCDPLCESIKYTHQTTMANLKAAKQLWGEDGPPPVWGNHSVAGVRFYFGSERTVPKIRKALYGPVDLIANTGGILGLCLGFSALSGIELVYFLTIRAFCSYCKRRAEAETVRVGGILTAKRSRCGSRSQSKSKVIQVSSIRNHFC